MEGYLISLFYGETERRAEVQTANGVRLPDLDSHQGDGAFNLITRVLNSIEEALSVQVVAVLQQPVPGSKGNYTRKGDLIGDTYWVFARPHFPETSASKIERAELPDCSGCDPRSEGTHLLGTKQHPD